MASGFQDVSYFTMNAERKIQTNFDDVLEEKWHEAQTNGIFRYILDIQHSKRLEGKYQFLAQLNPNRGEKRRIPENILSMKQPFDPERFNFTKISSKEIIMDLECSNGEDVIAVNVSPIERNHCLLLTERFKQLPQIMTKYSLRKAIGMFSLSHSRHLRLLFNSLCAYASVNHLHWHLYYLKYDMLLEYIDVQDYAGPVQVLVNYPGKGFCIKRSSVQSLEDLVDWAFLVVDYLQKKQIAHNVYITRGKGRPDETEYTDLRIYIWARKSTKGVKDTCSFFPAVCELFGHLSIRSQEAYNDLTEEYVASILSEITEETFSSIYKELQQLIIEQKR